MPCLPSAVRPTSIDILKTEGKVERGGKSGRKDNEYQVTTNRRRHRKLLRSGRSAGAVFRSALRPFASDGGLGCVLTSLSPHPPSRPPSSTEGATRSRYHV